MKETGLMFKAPLVRAILSGQKTQTRRLVKWRDLQRGLNLGFSGLAAYSYTPDTFTLESATRTGWERRSNPTRCPVGQTGDRIYVRETFARVPTVCGSDELVFAADYQDGSDKAAGVKYTTAIHMPKNLARIWLEITGLRVERLQQISEADCIAEGIHELPHQAGEPGCWWTSNVAAGAALHGRKPRNAFQLLWESTGGDWSANPWV